jgi:hypothetical protein
MRGLVVKVIVKRRGRLKRPRPVSNLKAKVDHAMKTVNLNWILPTTRVDGTALAPEAIAHTLVEISSDGVLFAELAKVASPETALIVPELESGTWTFRLTVVDKQKTPKLSAPVSVVVEVPVVELAAPSEITGITVVLS